MMDEQRTHDRALLEDMDRKLSMVAESTQAVAAMLADVKADFSRRFDELDVRFVGMTIEMRDLKAEVGTLGGKVDNLEAFAKDAAPRLEQLEGKFGHLETFAAEAGPRLVRIETHLALSALPPRRGTTKPTSSKHHRRKPTKRT